MATVVRPLDGAEGYLRWKESMLLRLHTVGVARVLSEDPPAGDEGAPAAAAACKKWARDDALCRCHILAALSDRLFPDYVRHATAREVWQAVARTYDVGMSSVARRRFDEFEFDEDAPLLEQIAHAEALAAGCIIPKPEDDYWAHQICRKLPGDVGMRAIAHSSNSLVTMSDVWRVARALEEFHMSHDEGLEGMQRIKRGGALHSSERLLKEAGRGSF